MYRSKVFGWTVIAATVMLLGPPGPARADRVDDIVRVEMRRQRIPGLAIAIVRNGRLDRSRGYGLANIEQNTRVTADTVFQIQSMTKSFTAAAILMLVEEGKVRLDEPVGRYLEGTPEAWNNITVRHLMSHTSGIKDYINDPTQSLRLEVADGEVLKAAAARPVDFAPGEAYAYSNTNYLLLGMIIRNVTGKPYGEMLRERIFEPLGMRDTRIMSWDEIIPHRAAGYNLSGTVWRNGNYIAGSVLAYPGGGILSTVRDIAKWDIALMEDRVLRESSRRMMWTPARLNDGKPSGYGLGWGVGDINGHPFQTHSGGHATGFSSVIVRFPEDRLSVIALANRSGVDTFRVARRIAARYVPDLAPPEKPAIPDKEPEVTAMLRATLDAIVAGNVDRTAFTPEMNRLLSPEALEVAAAMMRDSGGIRALELLERSEGAGSRTFLYRIRTREDAYEIRFTVSASGLISGADLQAG